MKIKLLKFLTITMIMASQSSMLLKAQTVSTVETFTLSPNSYWDGASAPLGTTFNSGNAIYQNYYDTAYGGYWSSGWAYSNMKDSTTAGYANLYSARPAIGYNGSSNYLVGKDGAIINLNATAKGKAIGGFYITNSTYAALSMKTGDSFAKKFGGALGNDPDWFKLTVKKWLGGILTNDSVEFYLADYRSANNAQDYIVKNWQWINLTSLGNIDSLEFTLSSSDVGTYGMNTPAYFCMDNFTTANAYAPPAPTVGLISSFENLTLSPNAFWNGENIPLGATFNSGNAIYQNYYDTAYGGYWSSGWAYSNMKDSTTAGYTNIFSARPAIGYNGSTNYSIGKDGAKINLNSTALGKVVSGFYVSNSTYAALSMKIGDSFAKKFGGASGNDPDWFKLTVKKWLGGVLTNDSVEFYLADYRSANNAQDYVVKNWQWVNLSSLGNVDSLQFLLSSSDEGSYGMNTPAYFCMDNFTTTDSVVTILASFAPPAGQAGSTAIHADSSAFVAWATGCSVKRGLQNISNPALGYTTVGDSSMAIGKADPSVVSLGDGGSAVLTFAHPIQNGVGNDFAVFENSFSDSFLELAFVEVSSDGTNFYRFPATCNTQNTVQLPSGGLTDATKINNLAGKYKALYGTPFDLQELASQSGLNIDSITHVKIVDVVGSIQNTYATYDKNNNKINDPWSTPFASSGFDLDAVGVINQRIITDINETIAVTSTLKVFPNPLQDKAVIQYYLDNNSNAGISISDVTGHDVYAITKNNQLQGWQEITISDLNLSNGIYFLKVETNTGIAVQKIIVSK